MLKLSICKDFKDDRPAKIGCMSDKARRFGLLYKALNCTYSSDESSPNHSGKVIKKGITKDKDLRLLQLRISPGKVVALLGKDNCNASKAFISGKACHRNDVLN